MENDNKQNRIQKKLSRGKYIIAAVILLTIIVSLVFIWFTQEQKSDPASEKVIRQAAARQLNKEPNSLTDGDFAKITELSAGEKVKIKVRDSQETEINRGAELSDITLLEKFTNLEKLDLSYIKYPQKNIPVWMSFLAKIHLFDLSKRPFLELGPLRKLTRLRGMNLNTTKIKSLTPLSKLTNLEVLDLYMVEVSDISPIRNLTKLRELQLTGNPISDFEPLSGLKNMQILSLYGTKISDLNPIKNLTNMRELELIMTNVSDLEPLRAMKNLQKLDLFETKVSNLEPISELTTLQNLRLYNTPISNIESLKNLSNLESIDISGTFVSDLEPLKKLKKLRMIYTLDCINITEGQLQDLKRALPEASINLIMQ